MTVALPITANSYYVRLLERSELVAAQWLQDEVLAKESHHREPMMLNCSLESRLKKFDEGVGFLGVFTRDDDRLVGQMSMVKARTVTEAGRLMGMDVLRTPEIVGACFPAYVLGNMFVNPGHQAHGLPTLLFRHARTIAPETHLPQVYACSFEQLAMIRWGLRNGYGIAGVTWNELMDMPMFLLSTQVTTTAMFSKEDASFTAYNREDFQQLCDLFDSGYMCTGIDALNRTVKMAAPAVVFRDVA